jgi:predicted dehydrogenase
MPRPHNIERKADMRDVSRRRFVVSSGAAAVGATALRRERVLGANERVVLGLVGAGGRGTQVALDFAGRHDAEIGCVCDLHEHRLAAACQRLGDKQGRPPASERELARMLDRHDLDAVIVATPDHWHALATIRACQAGKDVYVEKPPSQNVFEGRKIVEAARKYDRIVQVGTQNRSAPYNNAARDYIAAGKLGEIHLVKVFNLKAGDRFRLPPDDPPPPGFDWQAWLGPAPSRAHNSGLFAGGWHKFWAYSGGDFADDGIHQLDLALMLLGDPPFSGRVQATGGRFAFDDDQEVPDTQVVAYEFPKLVLTFELTGYPPYMDKIATDIRNSDQFPFWPQCATRIEIYGTKGLMYVGRHGGGWQVFGRAKQQSRPGELVAQMFGRPGDAPHEQNFIDSIRSRDRPAADIAIGHKTATLVHVGNIAHRVGNATLQFDPDKETFVGNAMANRLLRRENDSRYRIPDRV